MPLAYADGRRRNDAFRGAYSSGTATEGSVGGHDGGMAGLEGFEQPRGDSRTTTARWSPAVEDEHALKALELFGNPTEAEVPLPSRPESAAAARRLTQVIVLRHWGLTPKMTEDAVLLVSELVGNAVRHTGAR
ncbi:MAG: ATP-binding protein, partial [Streptomyces sp.]|nr:ATP-binding protein [Streptomyces sp.]